MTGIDLRPELEEMVKLIGQKNNYSGNKISSSIMAMFSVEITELHDGVLVPYWLGVVERGRGPARSGKNAGLWKTLYRWMERRNMFKSNTPKGKINEARSLAWYINKYGNKQFRSKAFIDIYTTIRNDTIRKIEEKFSKEIGKITLDVL